MRRTLILGASGYLGSNILAEFNPNNVVTVNRKPLYEQNEYVIDLACGVLDKNHQLFDEKPEVVIILSRPVTPEYEAYRVFHSNIQSLLLKWCANPELEIIHFASTTMVYSGELTIRTEDEKRQVCPYGIYEYFKLETELFLTFIGKAKRPDVDINLWRLPLLFGGNYDPSRHLKQFIYEFYSQYLRGRAWVFASDVDRTYGTSWAYLPDVAKLIAYYPRHHQGSKILNLASGFFTYFDLHHLFSKRLGTIGHIPLKLFRTRFEVKDEAGLPQMSIQDALAAVIWQDFAKCT